MKTLNNYLDECKEKKELKNDAELARYLGIARASLSIIRSGGGVSQETAEKIAEGAKIDLDSVWMASLIQREQNPRFKAILENVTKRAGIAAGIAMIGIMMTSGMMSKLDSQQEHRIYIIRTNGVFNSHFIWPDLISYSMVEFSGIAFPLLHRLNSIREF